MIEILLGGIATIIAQISKKTGVNPQLVAAVFAFIAAFFIEGYGALNSGTLDWQNLSSFFTIGGAAWASSVGIYEILKKQINRILPT